MTTIDEIHDMYVNGNQTDAMQEIEQYGEYQFFLDYRGWITENTADGTDGSVPYMNMLRYWLKRKIDRQELECDELSKLEKDVVRHGFGDNPYDDVHTWRWSVQPACTLVSKAQIGAVVTNMIKKGVLVADGKGNNGTLTLTDKGQRMLRELRS